MVKTSTTNPITSLHKCDRNHIPDVSFQARIAGLKVQPDVVDGKGMRQETDVRWDPTPERDVAWDGLLPRVALKVRPDVAMDHSLFRTRAFGPPPAGTPKG